MNRIITFFKINTTNLTSLELAKILFLIFFLAGNIAFFGFLLTKDPNFAMFGFFVLVIGFLLNEIFSFVLLILGGYANFISKKSTFNIHFKAMLVLHLNLPFAILYAWLGAYFFKIL